TPSGFAVGVSADFPAVFSLLLSVCWGFGFFGEADGGGALNIFLRSRSNCLNSSSISFLSASRLRSISSTVLINLLNSSRVTYLPVSVLEASARRFLISSTRAARRRSCSALAAHRSEEHTSELQSRSDLVCRLLLEKKK